jgi:hypothetical protein
VGSVAGATGQGQTQSTQWPDQLQQLFNQSVQLQNQLEQVRGENAQLWSQIQQLQPTAGTGSGWGTSQPVAGMTLPPAPVSGAPTGFAPTGSVATQPGGGAFAASTRPAPLIQNITQQLKRNPALQYNSRPLTQINCVVIHHTAITPTIGAERIAQHRVDSQGWPGIGYHYFITGEGQIQQTNDLTTVAYHAGDQYNPIAIGIAFAGDFTHTSPTPAQMEAGAQLIAWLIRELNLSPQAVYGYKELVVTQSPGDQWDSGEMWGAQLKQRILNYLR